MDVTDRRKRASEEAADWWARLQADDMTRGERELFIDWLRDSQTHIAEMLRLARVHGMLEQFQLWADVRTDGPAAEANVIPLQQRHELHAHPRKTLLSGKPTILAVAASLAAIAIATLVLMPQWGDQVIATERGERREVVLEDGTVVQVDPQTRLSVKFNESLRHVALAGGRAVFNVAKNSKRPFLVQADETTVRAIGTAFGVERRQRDIVIVTVAEGKVAVSSPRREGDGARNKEVLLGQNEQITVHNVRAMAPVRAVNSERELAWADGRLVFIDEPVSKVVEEFNRYNRVQLRVTDAALAARPVSGVFNAAKPEAFVAFIQNAAPVSVEREGERSIVISLPTHGR